MRVAADRDFYSEDRPAFSQTLRSVGTAAPARPAERVLASDLLGVLLLCLVLGSAVNAQVQQPVRTVTAADSAPSPQLEPKTPPKSTTPVFFGYATNRSLIFPDIATSPGTLSSAGKFKLFVNQSISPPYVVAAGLTAAWSQALDTPTGYGQGWGAYGGRFGDAIARASSNSFFSSFLLPSLLHQDPRFFPQTNPTWWRTVRYSARRTVFTQSDSGKEVFNYSGLLGPLAAEGLANAYLPSSEHTVAKTATRFGTDLAWQFAGYMFKNYWPSIFRGMGLNRLRVIPDPETPSRFKPEH